MLGSALSALSDRIDSKFLTAFWLPAFVAVLGAFGVLTVLVGPSRMETAVYDLDSVEQTLAVVLIVLAITMVAFVLRALSRPIVEVFAGIALPHSVARWSTHGQLKHKQRVARVLGSSAPDTADPMAQPAAAWVDRVYPLDDAETKPTLFGNVLATSIEHPRVAYTMEGILWWPRLAPLVPGAFSDMLGGAQAPMMALLNLSVVFSALALAGGATLALAGGHGLAALVTLAGGLTLAYLSYRAAVSQAREFGSLLRVGFDLYRHEILRQMDLAIPENLDEERALWNRLTADMIGLSQAPADTPSVPRPDAKQDAPADASTSA